MTPPVTETSGRRAAAPFSTSEGLVKPLLGSKTVLGIGKDKHALDIAGPVYV